MHLKQNEINALFFHLHTPQQINILYILKQTYIYGSRIAFLFLKKATCFFFLGRFDFPFWADFTWGRFDWSRFNCGRFDLGPI